MDFLRKKKKEEGNPEFFLDNGCKICYHILARFNMNAYPGVAQHGRVLDWGSRGRRFKSCHSDHIKEQSLIQKQPSKSEGCFCIYARKA